MPSFPRCGLSYYERRQTSAKTGRPRDIALGHHVPRAPPGDDSRQVLLPWTHFPAKAGIRRLRRIHAQEGERTRAGGFSATARPETGEAPSSLQFSDPSRSG